ncbi:unnamed protein product [Prunus armeniaca]|uniref:Nop domain-containing protein n=1 Tax=Prunus armeniaca TaxID=36596 RepID=A0A6J5UNE5_PRUAR|nr:unnamed protein product [Prunus armeniaca]CAB4308019.1 unnamed protein product [Prunus armeniaca]
MQVIVLLPEGKRCLQRMNTIAPNFTALVGELVGAHLIAHGGSLLNLAKQPGSTVRFLELKRPSSEH